MAPRIERNELLIRFAPNGPGDVRTCFVPKHGSRTLVMVSATGACRRPGCVRAPDRRHSGPVGMGGFQTLLGLATLDGSRATTGCVLRSQPGKQ